MNFDEPIRLMLSTETPIAGISSFAGTHIITMNPDFYNNSYEAEKIFVMGHEIAHAKNHHTEFKSIASLGIVLGTSSALIAYDIITQALFAKVEKNLKLHEKSYFSRMLYFLKTSNHIIATAPLVHWFLAKYLYYKFSQSLEIAADRESAQLLHCTQGGISFFEKSIAENAAKPSKSWVSYLNPFTTLKLINNRLGFLNHPSNEERIALLKKYV